MRPWWWAPSRHEVVVPGFHPLTPAGMPPARHAGTPCFGPRTGKPHTHRRSRRWTGDLDPKPSHPRTDSRSQMPVRPETLTPTDRFALTDAGATRKPHTHRRIRRSTRDRGQKSAPSPTFFDIAGVHRSGAPCPQRRSRPGYAVSKPPGGMPRAEERGIPHSLGGHEAVVDEAGAGVSTPLGRFHARLQPRTGSDDGVCRAQRPTSEAVAAEREGVFDPGQAQAGRRAGKDPGDEDPGRGEVDGQVGVVEVMRLQ